MPSSTKSPKNRKQTPEETMRKVSLELQGVLSRLESELEAIGGAKLGISLFVYTAPRMQYISNSNREEVKQVLGAFLKKWGEMPDIPAHEIN